VDCLRLKPYCISDVHNLSLNLALAFTIACTTVQAVTKKLKAMPNVKILVLSYPLRDLGVTHRVHLWLDGERIVDFLLAITELFSIVLMAAELLSEICQNRRFLKGLVTLRSNLR